MMWFLIVISSGSVAHWMGIVNPVSRASSTDFSWKSFILESLSTVTFPKFQLVPAWTRLESFTLR